MSHGFVCSLQSQLITHLDLPQMHVRRFSHMRQLHSDINKYLNICLISSEYDPEVSTELSQACRRFQEFIYLFFCQVKNTKNNLVFPSRNGFKLLILNESRADVCISTALCF